MREQLVQGSYPKARGRESNLRPSESQVQHPKLLRHTGQGRVGGKEKKSLC